MSRAGRRARDIVLHDYFEAAEGGGRLSLILALGLGADLAYGFKKRQHPYFTAPFPGREYQVAGRTRIPLWRQYRLARAFGRRTAFLEEYEAAVYSGFYTPLAVSRHPAGRNIYYCHTPPRFLYDQRDFFRGLLPAWQRPLLNGFNDYLQPRYEEAVRRMEVVVANSRNVQVRLRKYLGLESEVVHPPCEVERFRWLTQEDFYLSTARLDPLKRVDLVVRAFREMPEKKLVVASGGPEWKKINKLAAGAANIRVLGWVAESRLRELIGRCLATIYIPRDEDFGMSPVESMAAGKPVLGVDEGGLRETVVPGRTGLLLPPDLSVAGLREAVFMLDAGRAREMQEACERRAQLFRKEIFLERMERVLAGER